MAGNAAGTGAEKRGMVRPTLAALALVCLAAGAPAGDSAPAAVKVSLEKGIAAVRSGNVAEGIAHLERVVKEAPRVAHYRYLLAAAYSQARRTGDAWKQLRQAVRLDPTHQQAGQAFQRMWYIFGGTGAFNAGAPASKVLAEAGEPDEKTGRNGDERWAYGYMSVDLRKGRVYQVVDMRGLLRIPDAAASWRLPLDVRKWSIGQRIVNRNGSVAEWVRNGETPQDWERLFTVQRMFQRGGATAKARDIYERIEADLKRYCPKVEVQVIKDGERDLVYEWRIPEGAGPAPRHELVRIVIGKVDAHRLAYAGRGPQLPAEERAEWLKQLGEARLVARN